MATLVANQPQTAEHSVRQFAASSGGQAALLGLLTLSALAIHGYHPYSEDGGIYLAAAEHALHPQLFPHLPQFADAHVTCVFFSRIMAGIATLTHLSLTWVFFLAYIVSLYLTLASLHLILQRCMRSSAARWCSLLIFTVTMTAPVAGTSIITVDPYITSRSLSLPLVLFAIAESLRLQPRWLRIALLLLAGGLLHPLVAACGVFLIALTLAFRDSRRYAMAGILGFALLTALVVHRLAPPESAAYHQAVLSRPYWFLTQWSWDEIFGVIAPPIVLLALDRFRPAYLTGTCSDFVRALCLGGAAVVALNLIFAHPDSGNHLVASLQPLRFFTFLYIFMTLALGSLLSLLRSKVPAIVLCAALAGLMFCVQRSTYPSTAHLELPGRPLSNDWQNVFLWVRDNTPKDALFAMDADYNDISGEDTHLFRSIALRDALPDYSKDGGIAAVKPSIAGQWADGIRLQHGLDNVDDAERIARMKPAGVTWVILSPTASTRLDCPYLYKGIRVCRIP